MKFEKINNDDSSEFDVSSYILSSEGKQAMNEMYQKISLQKNNSKIGIIVPTPVHEQPWENPDWVDKEGKCWMGHPGDGEEYIPSWRYCRPEDAPNQLYSLPYWYLPLPQGT